MQKQLLGLGSALWNGKCKIAVLNHQQQDILSIQEKLILQ
jgi:hypothetical protein